MSKLTFETKGINSNPTRLVTESRNFEMIIDEPEELGGTNSGANPVEYILAGYAGCLNVVGHMIAKEQGLQLKGLRIHVSGDLDPAKLFGQSDKNRAGFQNIRVKIIPDTDATEEALNKWINEVESRCPVNDNLSNATPTSIEIAKSEVVN